MSLRVFLRALIPAVLVGLVGVAHAAEAVGGDVLRITIDQAKVVKLPPGTTTLVIGNPLIADVTMLKNTAGMVVTGKGYGQTNLIALDDHGNIVDEKQLRVEPGRSVLVVQRGDSRTSYSCDPWCMPTVQLGDDSKAFSDVGSQIQLRNGWATGGDKPK
jgi:hypothetical protein